MRDPARSLTVLGAVAMAVFLGGCATFGEKQAHEAFVPLLERYREEARELRNTGQKRAALEKLRAVAAFHPEDPAVRSQLLELEKELKESAQARFRRGRNLLEGGKTDAARREFILALADDPDHAEALDYLKNRFHFDSVSLKVAAGETLESIASRSYGDPEAAVVIARLNDLRPGEEARAGAALVLPAFGELARSSGTGSAKGDTAAAGKVEGYLTGIEPAVERSELAVAREYLEARNFEEALIAANSIAGEGESAQEAREIINASHYGLGKRFQEEERYSEALKSFEKTDPTYRDVKKLIVALNRNILAKAEEHYLAGVRSFIDQKLEEAINQWEKTLELNPDHPKAKQDLVKARKLIEQLQKIR